MKKLLTVLVAALLLVGCSAQECPQCEVCEDAPTVAELPAARDTSKTYKNADKADVACEANTYAAACSSINAENLHEYLNREDVVYIDLRDYADYAKKHLRNFESIPYFALIFNKTLDENTVQLYTGSESAPVSTYAESDDLLHALFPQDKTIFLMCQSGGRVANFMKILEAKGYDMSKVYNVGGMGQYSSDALKALTTNSEEIVLEGTYSFSGLTRN